MRTPALALLSAVAFSCAAERGTAPAATTAPPEPAVKVNEVAKALAEGVTLDVFDASTCEKCHPAVVAEWKESLHARAHHSKDPLYATMRTLRTEKQGAHIPGACANCHNPNDVRDHESPAAQAGVSCATCHQLEGVHLAEGKKGAAVLVKGPDKVFRGSHDIPNGTAPLHGTGPALPALVDGKTLCLACHGEMANPAGVSTCATGVEYAAKGETRSCAECHMPEVKEASGPVSTRATHRSHRFAGPHQAQRLGEEGVLAESVKLSGRFEDGKLVAKLENVTGHSFPTGFPARMVVLDMVAFDASGKEVFRNVKAEPMKEHPEAVLNKGYADAEGKPSLAPFAAKLVRDTRLTPGEVREVSAAVPAAAVKAELRLRFFLAAPPMLKTIGYQGPEGKPVVMAPISVTR